MATINKEPLNFEKVCRACLQVKKDMRPLFEQLTATMLMDISKVQVAVGDGLPTQLCLQCVHQISRCHAFKELVERNDVVLRDQAQKMAEADIKNKPIPMNQQDHNYMQYIDISNSNQLLDGLFSNGPLQIDSEKQGQEGEHKIEFQIDEKKPLPEKEEPAIPEDDNYMQLVLQATSTITPGRHVCNLCHKEFKHPRWLKLHMQFHTNWIKANCKKPPMCPVCGRAFKGPGMLKMHMRTHEARPTKTPTCSVCQRVFSSKTLLYRHRQTHFEQKTHQCTVCEKRFYSGYALRSHMARHRGERPFICSMCTKSFYNPTDLKVHFRLHTGEKPLKCTECYKTFRRHSTLCQHMKKHRGIRNHVCSVCNKGFFEVSKLNAHMRVHTGERPFSCQFCDRKFTQQSALIYHRRTHTGEKPYSCKVCNARFTTSSARNNHLETHVGVKKFPCPQCGKQCSSRVELRVHTATKHADKQTDKNKFTCLVCAAAFKDLSSLKKHTKTHEQKAETQSENSSESQTSLNTSKSDQENQQENTNQNAVEESTYQELQETTLPKRYKCGICVKTYMYLHTLKKHMSTHIVQNTPPTPTPQQQQQQHQQQLQQQHQQQLQQQQIQQVLQVGNVVPIHHVQQPITVQSAPNTYPVISSVQTLQLQQTQQQVNAQPQQLQVQTIQIHPQQHPIQIQAVGVHQVQQQMHVATSTCQTMLPNILQLQPAVGSVASLGQQDMSPVAHRIILQPQGSHPALYAIHH